VIQLEALTKRYAAQKVVDALTLDIAAGELLILLGGSGSGKTTTLKMINRLVEPSSGQVRIAGRDTRELAPHILRRGIGYCFQQVGLFPHLSVAENIGVTPSLLGWSESEIDTRVDQLLHLVELAPEEFRERAPQALSGGQQQRVGLARALAARPEVLLLDEPFGALDPLTRDRLQTAFQGIRRELGLTCVFVTHDMVEALLLGDRIAVLDGGRLAQVGSPDELMTRPANEYVAELMDTPRRQADALEALQGKTRHE
jgi:osmoprotectant transport system ATP-binding protein